jgi:ferritin-like metal-binding protein YciE
MPARTSFDEQLNKYLTDAHSIEKQALTQMKAAPKIAGDPAIESAFAEHLTQTEGHERLVRARLEARDASPSLLKDTAGAVTGVGFALFAKFNPDKPGKLVNHAYSYERMELAAYDLLSWIAHRAGDPETAELATRIGREEQAMADRLAGLFDRAVEASLHDQRSDDLGEQLNSYLSDAHAIEAQAIELLSKGADIVGQRELASAMEEHLVQTREQQRLIEQRLEARGASPSIHERERAVAEQRPEESLEMARIRVGGVAVEEAHELPPGRSEPTPHRVALADRRPEVGERLVLLEHARARGGVLGGAVGRRRVDDDAVVDEAGLGERTHRPPDDSGDRRASG